MREVSFSTALNYVQQYYQKGEIFGDPNNKYVFMFVGDNVDTFGYNICYYKNDGIKEDELEYCYLKEELKLLPPYKKEPVDLINNNSFWDNDNVIDCGGMYKGVGFWVNNKPLSNYCSTSWI